MFLKANYRSIPGYKDIRKIFSADIRKCLPARLNGKGRALLAAEAEVNPLVNSAPTTEGGIDLDKKMRRTV